MTTIISVGNGGCNVADSISKNTMDFGNAQLIYCDTNAKALAEHGRSNDAKLLLSPDITEFPGVFPKDCETLIVIATLGGKSGNLVAPLVAKKAKEMGIKRIIGAVTLPFVFEGEQHYAQAGEAAKSMAEHCHEMVIHENENLKKKYEDLNFFTAFKFADLDMAQSLGEIII